MAWLLLFVAICLLPLAAMFIASLGERISKNDRAGAIGALTISLIALFAVVTLIFAGGFMMGGS